MTFPTPAKYKKEFPFLKEIDSLALANAQLNLDKAYKNFFFGINPLDFHVSKVRKILFRVIQRIIKMVQLL
jgi:transposase